jgi:hypothetical protein
MSEDVNVWIFPIQGEILITDQTGGVPIDCCNLPEYYSKRLEEKTGSASVLYHFKGENSWSEAVKCAEEIRVKLGYSPFDIKYDNWWGREVEAEYEAN